MSATSDELRVPQALREQVSEIPAITDRFCEEQDAWLVKVNGIIVDARWLPAKIQAEARLRGLIPALHLGEAP